MSVGFDYLIGYINKDTGWERKALVPTPENIASFIMEGGCAYDKTITTPLDMPFLNTFGFFIDRCADQDFLTKELLPVLVPMQEGEREPIEVQEIKEPEVLDYVDNTEEEVLER